MRKQNPGARAEQALRWIGVDRRQAAREIGVSLSLIAMNFAGASALRDVTALALQARFGVNARWILHGEAPVFLRPRGLEQISDEAMAAALACERMTPSARKAFVQMMRAVSLQAEESRS